MALTPYCSNDEVRAVLGVTSSELGDLVLDLPVYETGLKREVQKISQSLPAAFFSALSVDTASRTTVQQALVEATQLFSVYAVAKQAGAPLAMAAPKSLNDDKSGFSRDSNSPYKDVLERVDSAFYRARQELQDAYAAFVGASATTFVGMPVGLRVSSRVTDPVTGS